MREPAPSLSRRTTLGLAGFAAGLGLAGCSSWNSLKPPKPVTPSPSPNVDQALVDEIATKLTGAARSAPAPFRALNHAHLQALPAARTLRAPGHRRGWRTQERQLAADLADGAVRARDGELARLLASMAAAQLQLLHARGLA